MTVKQALLKLKTNFQSMALSPKPDKDEWLFYLSIVGFVAVVLLMITFPAGWIGYSLAALLFVYSGFFSLWDRS